MVAEGRYLHGGWRMMYLGFEDGGRGEREEGEGGEGGDGRKK